MTSGETREIGGWSDGWKGGAADMELSTQVLKWIVVAVGGGCFFFWSRRVLAPGRCSRFCQLGTRERREHISLVASVVLVQDVDPMVVIEERRGDPIHKIRARCRVALGTLVGERLDPVARVRACGYSQCFIIINGQRPGRGIENLGLSAPANQDQPAEAGAQLLTSQPASSVDRYLGPS